ncbi:MAG TPA: LCP family protein [Acidimicrobiia bacterium]|nr:LCP family protein [Acidimicrobiia bacterium]
MSSSSPRHLAPRRGLPKWLKITILGLSLATMLGPLAVFWALNTGENVLALAESDEEVVRELTAAIGDTLTFLVVGSDSRERLGDLAFFGPAGGERGDVIMLVHLDQTTGVARILSIPRDLWVDIPGNGEGKINAAYSYGGPSLMVQTIRENLGIEVNHYVEVDFVGFIEMVDELGGIEMTFPYPARDAKSGLSVDAGTQILDGEQALAFARSRRYQEYQNDTWVSVDASDLGRTERQQEVVRAILTELKTPASIAEAGEIAGSMAEHMTIDAALATSSVASLAWDFRGLVTGSIDGQTLPVYADTVNGASVVMAAEPEASAMIDGFLSGVETIESAPLRIQVLNGNGIAGAASAMSERLAESGFEIAGVGNAEARDYATTTIVVPDGSTAGDRIIGQIGFGVVQIGTVDNGYDAVVIVGADAS